MLHRSVEATAVKRTLRVRELVDFEWLLSARSRHTKPRRQRVSLLMLLRLKRALPLFRVDEPPFLVDLVTFEPEQN